MSVSKLPPKEENSASLRLVCAEYDALILPKLMALAIITSVISALGILGQMPSQNFDDYVLAAIIGFVLWIICSGFWYGAWLAPVMARGRPRMLFAIIVVFGFASYSGISVTANYTTTAGQAAEDLSQQRTIDGLENAGVKMAAYVGDLGSVQAGIADRATQASRLQAMEASGGGPTGVAGRGPVYDAYGLSQATYQNAADLIIATLTSSEARVAALQAAIANLRAIQADDDRSRTEKELGLKAAIAAVLSEMRGLLALDPVGTLRQAADSIARGVPAQSGVSAASQARINDISADMRLYAQTLRVMADRLAATVPKLPSQISMSITEQLWATAASMPALVALALLLDICGFIFCGYRLSLYQNMRATAAKENASDAPTVVLFEEVLNTEYLVERAAETHARIAAARPSSTRGRSKTRKPTKPKDKSEENNDD